MLKLYPKIKILQKIVQHGLKKDESITNNIVDNIIANNKGSNR